MRFSDLKFQISSLLLLVALPYLAGLRHDFVYDDHGSIAENPFLENPANVTRVLKLETFSDPHVSDGQRPAVILSYFFDRAIWGLKPFGYHLTNLVLHLAVVLSLFLLLRLLHSSIPPFLPALLFGLHPVLTEAVQCPAFREDLLLGLFGILYLAANFVRNRPALVVLQTVALALALGSKETAVVLPGILVWMWICIPASRPAPGAGIASLSIGLAMVAAYLLTGFASRPLQAASGTWNGLSLLFPSNIFTAPSLFHEYVRLLIWPHPLCVDRVVEPVLRMSEFRFEKGVITLVLWTFLAVALVRRAPAAALGMGWMLLAFVPVSNLVPLFNPMADRYLYFMAPGFVLLLPPLKRAHFMYAALAAVYMATTSARIADWKNDLTLWTATALTEPLSARAESWLALDLKHRGQLDDAVAHFRRADQLNPHNVAALINLAVIDGERGDLASAERRLREAIRRRPDIADAHWNLAHVLMLEGQYAAGMQEVRKTLVVDPSHPQARALIKATGLKKL